MFHVEIRAGMNAVREFNLTEQRLWVDFLSPLMADASFTVEGHEFVPRETRLKVYEGPELRPDQLGVGRGWQNVERTATDVTERVLERAREHTTKTQPDRTPRGDADLLRERLIGRLAAGPIAAREILTVAAELMPDTSELERLEVARQAAWALLERDLAQLAPSAR